MSLKIVNSDRMIGETFCDGRFVCTNVSFSITQWRFQFLDTEHSRGRYVWVEIDRNSHWDNRDQKWYYMLNYPKIPQRHQVSADWFGDIDNARATFETALKHSV